jgi:hypothetical protein
MGLSFTIAAAPRQRSPTQVRVPRDPWPHFTVSDSRPTDSCFSRPPYNPVCADRVENTVFNGTSILSCVSVAAGTCLPNHCLETALVYLLISRSLHSNGSTPYNIMAVTLFLKVCDIADYSFCSYDMVVNWRRLSQFSSFYMYIYIHTYIHTYIQ